ncbi:MAG: hypothetical protein IJ398_07010 [Clostridia bacterium]|nr:hypothetical protein [Clostridia bacterium]
MKKSITIITILVMLLALSFVFTSCGKCEHTYDNECDATCNECGETRQTVAHQWNAADCTTPKTCKTCGTTEGEALGHTPATDDGNCTTEVKCGACGETVIPAKAEHTLEKYVDNEDGMHCLGCLYCDYADTATAEAHNDYLDENCKCSVCGVEQHFLEWIDEGDCECSKCGEYIHNPDESCICTICSSTYHALNPITGICTGCNSFMAAASVTFGGSKSYYSTYCEALSFANEKEGVLMVIENDCVATELVYFENGSIIVDLNGKTVDSTGRYVLYGENADITIRDSVGGGKVTKYVGGDVNYNNLVIEGGIYDQIFTVEQTTITGGEFAKVSIAPREIVTISGGSFEEIEYNGDGTLADILTDGYCFYDKDGNVVDTSTIQANERGRYCLYNVTVGAIK